MSKQSPPKFPAANGPKAKPAAPAKSRNPFALNQDFNQQSRKLLGKHYRAKFGASFYGSLATNLSKKAGAPVRLHRIRNDQLYHYYLGDPIEVLLLRGEGEHVIVGPDLRAGHRVQLLIPGNTFHTARIVGSRRWFLGASTEWPGVIPADVELGKPEILTAQFPKVAADIRSFPQPAD